MVVRLFEWILITIYFKSDLSMPAGAFKSVIYTFQPEYSDYIEERAVLIIIPIPLSFVVI